MQMIHPQRFPIKPELGHKGGSIPWADAEPLLEVWQMRYGRDGTDHKPSMFRLACSGGLPASQLDSLNRAREEHQFHLSGKTSKFEWRTNFIAGDHDKWTNEALQLQRNSEEVEDDVL